MQVIHQSKHEYILKFKKGEELVEGITKFCKKNDIRSGWIQALGAGSSVSVSYYDLQSQKYIPKKFDEEFEILSIIGNISIMNEKTILHAHAVLGRKDYSTFGGHLNSLVISGTGEVRITTFDAVFTRRFDEETGLNLLSSD